MTLSMSYVIVSVAVTDSLFLTQAVLLRQSFALGSAGHHCNTEVAAYLAFLKKESTYVTCPHPLRIASVIESFQTGDCFICASRECESVVMTRHLTCIDCVQVLIAGVLIVAFTCTTFLATAHTYLSRVI